MATCRADNGERVNLFQLVELASGLLAPVEMSYIYVLINSKGDKVEFSIHSLILRPFDFTTKAIIDGFLKYDCRYRLSLQ